MYKITLVWADWFDDFICFYVFASFTCCPESFAVEQQNSDRETNGQINRYAGLHKEKWCQTSKQNIKLLIEKLKKMVHR